MIISVLRPSGLVGDFRCADFVLVQGSSDLYICPPLARSRSSGSAILAIITVLLVVLLGSTKHTRQEKSESGIVIQERTNDWMTGERTIGSKTATFIIRNG